MTNPLAHLFGNHARVQALLKENHELVEELIHLREFKENAVCWKGVVLEATKKLEAKNAELRIRAETAESRLHEQERADELLTLVDGLREWLSK